MKTGKITKREMYAKYGIEFDGTYIHSPLGLIRELLKEGNTKTGKKVLTWSMTPGNGEGGTCVCTCEGCYAMTGRYNMGTVKESLRRNTELVNYHLDFFRRAVSAQLEYIENAEIRIHAAGDFNTLNADAYAWTWHDIAAKFTQHAFWAYTKIEKYESLFDGLDNANIVKSIIPGKGVNYGHCDYILELYAFLKAMKKDVYICRCGIDKNQHCEKCGHCSAAEYVLFIEHSTEYVAETDPAFPELKAVIESQDNTKVTRKTA